MDPWVEKIPWRTAWHPTPVLLPGKSHGQRSLVGCSPWGLEESDTSPAQILYGGKHHDSFETVSFWQYKDIVLRVHGIEKSDSIFNNKQTVD